jgi:hypothetical protein
VHDEQVVEREGDRQRPLVVLFKAALDLVVGASEHNVGGVIERARVVEQAAPRCPGPPCHPDGLVEPGLA